MPSNTTAGLNSATTSVPVKSKKDLNGELEAGDESRYLWDMEAARKTKMLDEDVDDGNNMVLVNRFCLPAYLDDNEYLIDCHRPELRSATRCIQSIFVLHTETINIWTHLAGT